MKPLREFQEAMANDILGSNFYRTERRKIMTNKSMTIQLSPNPSKQEEIDLFTKIHDYFNERDADLSSLFSDELLNYVIVAIRNNCSTNIAKRFCISATEIRKLQSELSATQTNYKNNLAFQKKVAEEELVAEVKVKERFEREYIETRTAYLEALTQIEKLDTELETTQYKLRIIRDAVRTFKVLFNSVEEGGE